MKNCVLISIMMLVISVASQQTVKAQTTSEKDITKQKRHTSVYLELLGTSGLYSINAEERWQVTDKSQFGIRVGFTKYRYDFWGAVDKTSVPVMLNYSLSLESSKEHFIEVGAGVNFSDLRGYYLGTLNFQTDDTNYVNGLYVIPTGSLAYRYQNPKGFMLKASFTPSLKYSGLVGVSIGYSF
jgi:hypothetical protein